MMKNPRKQERQNIFLVQILLFTYFLVESKMLWKEERTRLETCHLLAIFI